MIIKIPSLIFSITLTLLSVSYPNRYNKYTRVRTCDVKLLYHQTLFFSNVIYTDCNFLCTQIKYSTLYINLEICPICHIYCLKVKFKGHMTPGTLAWSFVIMFLIIYTRMVPYSTAITRWWTIQNDFRNRKRSHGFPYIFYPVRLPYLFKCIFHRLTLLRIPL